MNLETIAPSLATHWLPKVEQNEEGGRSSTQFEGGQVTLRIMQNSLGRSFQICCNTEESCIY